MTPQFQGGRRGPTRSRSPKAGSPSASTKSSEAIRPLDPTLTPPDIATFRHWELGEEIQSAIEGMGITKPSPIQSLAIGPVLAGKDVIAKAETGTGKTLAFGAPMMAKIDPQRASVLGLVLCPTRELAEQVQKVLSALGKPRGIEVALIVGGEPMEPQVKALKRGAQVVVGTPGRILDLYKQKFLNFPWTEFTILDEADVMFEFGFIDDVKEILSYTPDERQTLLFSATFPIELLKLARENTRDPAEVATASGLKTVDNIEQSVIFLDDEDRTLALMRLIENSDPEDVFLVFCPRRTDVDKLIRRLERMPFAVKALHGGYDQAARFRVMNAFRTGEVKALIATDVASRGLDVAHVTTVVNYGSPHDITDYTHRIGRTGRAGRKGRAITLVGGIDRRKWTQIEREATWKIPEVDPPLRGERPRGPRHDAPVAHDAPPRREAEPREAREHADRGPRTDRGPRREHAGAAERGGPRADRAPRRESRTAEPRSPEPRSPEARSPEARSPAPRSPEARSPAPRSAEARSLALRAPEARSPAPRAAHPRHDAEHPAGAHASGERGDPRSWPRDEHSPARARAAREVDPERQIEPRPDDPVDRRDRPLRHRSEAPRWPRDDDAPAGEERARDREARGPSEPARSASPRDTGREAPRRADRGAPAPRESAPGHAPRSAASGSSGPRTQRHPAPGSQERGADPRLRDERARNAEPALPRRPARDEAPQRPAHERATRATQPRPGAPRREDFAPLDVEPEHDLRPRGPDPRPDPRPDAARRPASGGEGRRGAPDDRGAHDRTAPARAPRRADSPPRAREPRREEHAPRSDAPRSAAPREPAPRRGAHAPREPSSRPAAPGQESAAPHAPALPRRRIAPPRSDAGEVRPIQSREREPRPER